MDNGAGDVWHAKRQSTTKRTGASEERSDNDEDDDDEDGGHTSPRSPGTPTRVPAGWAPMWPGTPRGRDGGKQGGDRPTAEMLRRRMTALAAELAATRKSREVTVSRAQPLTLTHTSGSAPRCAAAEQANN